MNNVKRKYSAHAIENGDFICIETYSGYRGGTHADPKGASHLLPPDTTDAQLGEALVDALARSRFVLPAPRKDIWTHPDVTFDRDLYDHEQVQARYRQWTSCLMARYGYKTKRALFKNMKNCSIELDGDVITICPSFHEKLETWSGEGITEEDYAILPANSSPSEIGAALRLAFSRCT